uniref:Uncharacterized protein n=1 Tax=Meloidogyne javanica TaxID=6303 RepID=A0A915LSN3_MELJA
MVIKIHYERARGISPESAARNAYIRAINPWFINGPGDAGSSGAVVPEGAGAGGFIIDVPRENLAVDVLGASDPAGSETPRRNVQRSVPPRTFPSTGDLQRVSIAMSETDVFLEEAGAFVSHAQNLMDQAARLIADADRLRSEMKRLFQIVEELHSDVHQYEADADRRTQEADDALNRAFELMDRRRALIEQERQWRLWANSRKRPVSGDLCTICQFGSEEVSLQYMPSGCLCLSFCNGCVLGGGNQDGLLNIMKKSALLKSLHILEGEENLFDGMKFEEIINEYPHFEDIELKLECPLCKRRFDKFVRRTHREPKPKKLKE